MAEYSDTFGAVAADTDDADFCAIEVDADLVAVPAPDVVNAIEPPTVASRITAKATFPRDIGKSVRYG